MLVTKFTSTWNWKSLQEAISSNHKSYFEFRGLSSTLFGVTIVQQHSSYGTGALLNKYYATFMTVSEGITQEIWGFKTKEKLIDKIKDVMMSKWFKSSNLDLGLIEKTEDFLPTNNFDTMWTKMTAEKEKEVRDIVHKFNSESQNLNSSVKIYEIGSSGEFGISWGSPGTKSLQDTRVFVRRLQEADECVCEVKTQISMFWKLQSE